MQTFLPYDDFERTAKCLDYKRLGKQRVEAKQILDIITGKNPNSRWRNHPAVKMWVGFENALGSYMNYMIAEWIKRGYVNNMEFYDTGELPSWHFKYYNDMTRYVGDIIESPTWLQKNEFHSSHRAALLFKDYDYYKQFNWSERPRIKYYWPI